MTTLAINFWAENITEEQRSDFMTAISHETALMNIQELDRQISSLEKKIEKGEEAESTTTPEELEALKVQLQSLKDEKAAQEESATETEEVYTLVVDTMSQKNADHFGNDKDVVRTVLRVLGTWDNSKLVKYAIIPAFKSPELYEALETIHVNSKAGEDGNLVMSKEVKQAYKSASQELERIIKVTFSLPFETPYTSKTRVKMTAEDKKLLNDCYIKGFKNKFSQDDSGKVSFSSRQLTKLVKEKKDKKTGEMKYDYSGLATTISNIVIKHYFA